MTASFFQDLPSSQGCSVAGCTQTATRGLANADGIIALCRAHLSYALAHAIETAT